MTISTIMTESMTTLKENFVNFILSLDKGTLGAMSTRYFSNRISNVRGLIMNKVTYIQVNRFTEGFGKLLSDINRGLKNYLRYMSYPNEKDPIIVWIFYLSYLIVHVSVIMGIVSAFLFPNGVWQLFATVGAVGAFICGCLVLVHDPK